MANISVIKLAFLILLSILPSLISLFVLRRVKQRWQARLRRFRLMTVARPQEPLTGLTNRFTGDGLWGSFTNYDEYNNYDEYPEEYSTELERYFVGDVSCRYNAHSPYIRCAVNPAGPCQDCIHYQSK